MKYIPIIAFVLLALAQLAIPGDMIWRSERVLHEGTYYKFRTAPIDPNDPFRGKYITLSFDAQTYEPDTLYGDWEQNMVVYVLLEEDSAGWAAIHDVSMTAPVDDEHDYVKAKVDYAYSNSLRIEYPFERYYMEETKAKDAENIYWRGNWRTNHEAWGLVSVQDGDAVLSDVLVNGTPILELVEELQEEVND